MVPEIQAVQQDSRANFLALQPAVEKTAVDARSDPSRDPYLTDYSVSHGEQVVAAGGSSPSA